jgi:uncharacterized protein YkwD
MVLPALAAVLVLAAQGSDALDSVAEALAAEIRAARAGAGIRAVDEPAAAMDLAQEQAERAARLPPLRRMSAQGVSKQELARAGLPRIAEVREFVQEQEGYEDPVAAAVEGFRNHPLWRRALGPEVTAIGAGAARAADGTALVVLLLLEETPVRDLRAMEGETEKAVNRVRAQHGLRPLIPSETLIEVARAHSEDMLRRKYFDHVAPGGSRPADRVTAAGVHWLRVTENLAMNAGMDDPVEQAVRGWMDSRGHRGNILDPDVTHTGVGIAEDENGAYTFTQLFVVLRPTHR